MERLRARGYLVSACISALCLFLACDEEAAGPGPVTQDAGAEDGTSEDAKAEALAETGDGEPDGAAQEGGADAALDGGTMRRTCVPFGPSVATPSQAFGHVLVLADLDCDSRLDAVRNHFLATPGGLVGGRVDFQAGRGDGSFGEAVSIEQIGGPTDMVTGDFDGDGVSDLVVETVAGIQSEHRRLLLIRGQCEKGPGVPEVVLDPNPLHGADKTVADVNRDGADDLIVSRNGERERVEVLFGGSVPFERRAVSEALPEGISQVAVADLLGDGAPEIIAASESRWAILSDNGAGVLMIVGVSEVEARGMIALEAMDLENDGSEELVALRALGSSVVDVYRYQPESGRFLRETLLDEPGLEQLVVGDVTGEGRQDLAVLAPDHTDLLIKDRGELLLGTVPSTDGTLAIGDVTGDGHADLVYGSSEWLKTYPNLPDACEHRLPRW